MKTNTATKTAPQVYEENRQDVHALLSLLGQEIGKREQEYAKRGIHWGHAGSAGFWKESLVTLLTSVMGANDEEACHKMIEETLADLRS